MFLGSLQLGRFGSDSLPIRNYARYGQIRLIARVQDEHD